MPVIVKDMDLQKELPKDIPVKQEIPTGYIAIKLASNGLFDVPHPVHIRNFRTEELVNISVTNDEDIPTVLTSTLNNMIYEDTDVKLWPERCVIELIVRIYANFFSPVLQSIPFPIEQSDIQYAEEHKLEDILFKIKTDSLTVPLDIRSVSIESADKKLKKYITIKEKDSDYSVKLLAYPRFGDVIEVQKYIKQKYRSQARTFDRLTRALENEEDLTDEQYDLVDQYYEYLREQTAETIRATKVLYIAAINGEDVESLPLDEKLKKYDNDPRLLDVKMSKVIDREYKKFTFGIKPEISMMNPVTGEECVRRFSFRLLDILQAIKTFEPDGYDISYDD